MRFKALTGNKPGTPEYRSPVVLRQGEDFNIKNSRVVMTKSGAETVGIALFNDRWFWDDYQFRYTNGKPLNVDPKTGGVKSYGRSSK